MPIDQNAPSIYTPEFIPYYHEIAQKYTMSPYEALIYGFIRFYLGTSKNKQFYFNNEDLAKIVGYKNSDSVSLAISKLVDFGFIKCEYQIKQGGGKIRFIKWMSNDPLEDKTKCQEIVEPIVEQSPTLLQSSDYINNNNLNNNKIITNVITESESLQPFLIDEVQATQPVQEKDFVVGGVTRRKKYGLAKKTTVKKIVYGNGDVSSCISYLKEKMNIPILDGSQEENRRYCWLLMNKFAGRDEFPTVRVEKVKEIVDAAVKDKFWQYKVTSFKKLYYNAVSIISSTRYNKFSVLDLSKIQ